MSTFDRRKRNLLEAELLSSVLGLLVRSVTRSVTRSY